MDWMQTFGLDKLNVYFDLSCDGMDGECFHYSVYFSVPMTPEKCDEAMQAVSDYFEPYYEQDDTYPGDIFPVQQDDHLDIELDLGNVKPDAAFQNRIIQGVIVALTNVHGIGNVIVNQGCDDYC